MYAYVKSEGRYGVMRSHKSKEDRHYIYSGQANKVEKTNKCPKTRQKTEELLLSTTLACDYVILIT